MVPFKEQLTEWYKIFLAMISHSEVVLCGGIIKLFHTLLCKLCKITVKG